MPSRRVAALAELWDGEMRGCTVDGRRVLLVKIDGTIFAYDDRCPHLGMPLSEGSLEAGVITCAAHCFEFEACTGAGVNPRNLRLRRHAVAIAGGEVWVELEPEATA